MIKQKGKHRLMGMALTALLMLGQAPAFADSVAINKVLGGVRGINNGTFKNGDGSNEAQVSIRVRQLKLIKQARTLAGKILSTSDSVARGQRIYFLFIIENDIESSVDDIRLSDAFNENQFTYLPDTMEVVQIEQNATSISAGAEDPFWKNSGSWLKLSDGVDQDPVSVKTEQLNGIQSYSVQVGATPNLKALDIPGKTTWALRFQVKVKGKNP